MSTAKTSQTKLRAQAQAIAIRLKTATSEMRAKNPFKVGIAMDDKIITLTFRWEDLDTVTGADLVEFIYQQMKMEVEVLPKDVN